MVTMKPRGMIFVILLDVLLAGLVHGAEPRRDVLPLPDPKFQGEIGTTVENSKPGYP